jgi:serine/threonine protein phosphatase PrpC
MLVNLIMLIQQISLKGKRPTNEDEHIIFENLNDNDTSINNINLIGIFDGHGGGGVSKFLKEQIPSFFLNKRINKILQNSKYLEKYIVNVFDKLQNKLEKNHPIISKKSGSTALIAIEQIQNDKLILMLINLGDCRAVLCNKRNIAIQLSKDHKPNNLEERIRINELGGIVRFDGADWRIGDLSVSRAMGDLDNAPFITYQPEIYKYVISRNDKFIIFACDGLWDVFTIQEVIDVINEYLHQGQDPNKVNFAKLLADFAIRHGSTDNVSVIIQFINR